MARTELRGGDQIKNFTVLRDDLTLDFLGASDWDITNGANNATITGLKDGVNDQDAATIGQVNDLISGLVGMVYKGVLDASIPNPDLDAINNKAGDFYKISVAGTFLSTEFAVGDMLIVNKDVDAGTTITSADIDKIDNTETDTLLDQSDVVDNLSSTGVVIYPLSANQGYVLDQKIIALDALVNTRVYSDDLSVTHNSPIAGNTSALPIAGTERVYLNGLRMFRGTGNDYTISGSTITFEYNLKTNDFVLCDYEVA